MNLISISKITSLVQQAINAARPKQSTVPAILLACSAINRPGISAMKMAASLISKQKTLGFAFGKLPDGSTNGYEAMMSAMCKEWSDAFKFDSRACTSVPIGALNIMGSGECAVGGVSVQCTNIDATNLYGHNC